MRDLHGRLVAFDLDGTLIDSRRDLAGAANDLIVEGGGRPLPLEAITGMIGDGAAVLVRRALAAAAVPGGPDALPRFLAHYDARLLEHTRLYDGVLDVVRAAHRRARIALLTNKPLEPTLRILDGLGIRGWFDDIIGGDGPWPRKPDPGALRGLMAAARARPESTLMIGDSPVDLETAVRAGARACVVTYGFGRFTDPIPAPSWTAVDVPALSAALDAFLLLPSTGGDRA